MKKLFQKLLQKFVKKAATKAVSNNDVVIPEVEPAKSKDPWWVILLKILSYIISLILGGVVTSCANL